MVLRNEDKIFILNGRIDPEGYVIKYSLYQKAEYIIQEIYSAFYSDEGYVIEKCKDREQCEASLSWFP